MMTEVLLENRDYTVIVAKTAAKATPTPPGFETRWVDARAAIVTLAQTCEQLDPDGINIYISSAENPTGCFKRYIQVPSQQIEQIFAENYPPETLDLLDGLKTALDDYFDRKAKQQTKPNGEIIIVLIDGEPRDRMDIVKILVSATEQMDTDEELGIGFVQIGDDLITKGFLTALDEDLRSRAQARFDIVHTRTLEAIEPLSLLNFLTDIIQC